MIYRDIKFTQNYPVLRFHLPFSIHKKICTLMQILVFTASYAIGASESYS